MSLMLILSVINNCKAATAAFSGSEPAASQGSPIECDQVPYLSESFTDHLPFADVGTLSYTELVYAVKVAHAVHTDLI